MAKTPKVAGHLNLPCSYSDTKLRGHPCDWVACPTSMFNGMQDCFVMDGMRRLLLFIFFGLFCSSFKFSFLFD